MQSYNNGDPIRSELGHLDELIAVAKKTRLAAKLVKVSWAGRCVWSHLGCPGPGQC